MAKPKHFREVGPNAIRYLVLLVAALIFIVPFYIVLITSFKATNALATQSPFVWFPAFGDLSWKGYQEIFTTYTVFETGESMILVGMKNTLIIMVPVILVGMFSSSIAAYAFSKLRFKSKKWLFGILMSSMMLPSIILLVPSYFLFENLGILESMPFFPLIVPPMFGSATAVFFLKGYFDSIPNDLFDAAKVDGLNYIQTYFHLILPIAKPAILSQALLGIVAVFNDYLLPLTYLLNEKDYTLQIALAMFSTGNNTNLPTVMAGSVISLIPMLILYFAMQKFFVQGLASSGVKG